MKLNKSGLKAVAAFWGTILTCGTIGIGLALLFEWAEAHSWRWLLPAFLVLPLAVVLSAAIYNGSRDDD